MDDGVIYDFETLSQNPINGAIVSLAILSFNFEKLRTNSYTYETLLNDTYFFKFDVREQVEKFDRIIEQSTLDWWQQQDKEALKKLKPSKDDVSIKQLVPFFKNAVARPEKIKTYFTRNNTFDPVILYSISNYFNQPMPHDWWKIRDTKSFIDGLTYGAGIRDSFIPPDCENKYVKHDPVHDVVLDVMRLQVLLNSKFGDDNA